MLGLRKVRTKVVHTDLYAGATSFLVSLLVPNGAAGLPKVGSVGGLRSMSPRGSKLPD